MADRLNPRTGGPGTFIAFKTSVEMARAIADMAARLGLSRSATVRQVLQDAIDEWNADMAAIGSRPLGWNLDRDKGGAHGKGG